MLRFTLVALFAMSIATLAIAASGLPVEQPMAFITAASAAG